MDLLIDTNKTYEFIENIFKLVRVLSVTEEDIQYAFDQKWKDFEDCVRFTAAKNNRIDYNLYNTDYSDSIKIDSI